MATTKTRPKKPAARTKIASGSEVTGRKTARKTSKYHY